MNKVRHRCTVCSRIDAELHHVKTRKSGGSDNPHNLMPLCRKHHTEIHQIGTTTFSEKYPIAKNWLISNHWNKYGFVLKWKHDEEK